MASSSITGGCSGVTVHACVAAEAIFLSPTVAAETTPMRSDEALATRNFASAVSGDTQNQILPAAAETTPMRSDETLAISQVLCPEIHRIKFYLVPCGRGRRTSERSGSLTRSTRQRGVDLAEEVIHLPLYRHHRCHNRCGKLLRHLPVHRGASILQIQAWKIRV